MLKLTSLFIPKSSATLGVDISSTSVKILQLSSTASGYCVDAYAHIRLPDDVMEHGMVVERAHWAHGVRSWLAKTKRTYKYAVIAVLDASTMSSIVQISNSLSACDREELAVIESKKYSSQPKANLYVDFTVLGRSDINPALLDLLIVASHAEHVNNRVAALRLAGLRTNIVDVESYALERAARLCPLDDNEKTVAIIDLGAVFTRLVVLHASQRIFSREDRFGGHHLALDPGNLSVEGLIPAFRSTLLSHIRRLIQWFYATANTPAIDCILLAGGLANQSGLALFLESQLLIKTRVANPFLNMTYATTVNRDAMTRDASLFMTACGLALRACTTHD